MKQKREHLRKIRMARKMLTAIERKMHCPVFLSQAWTKRKELRMSKGEKV